jgi:membrane protease YdiL (CAAX protease family)
VAEPLTEPIDAERRDRRWGLGDAAAGFALGFIGSLFAAAVYFTLAGDADRGLVTLVLLQIPLWIGLLGMPLWAARAKGNGARRDLGLWMRWTDAPLGLLVGAGLQLLVLPALYYPIFRLTSIDPDDVSEPALDLTERADGWFGVSALILLVVIGAPIAEELFYRGLLLRSLEKRGLPVIWAVVISSVLFALSHFQFIQFPALLVFGLVAGWLAVRTGRLGASIWTHLSFNLTSVFLLLL